MNDSDIRAAILATGLSETESRNHVFAIQEAMKKEFLSIGPIDDALNNIRNSCRDLVGDIKIPDYLLQLKDNFPAVDSLQETNRQIAEAMRPFIEDSAAIRRITESLTANYELAKAESNQSFGNLALDSFEIIQEQSAAVLKLLSAASEEVLFVDKQVLFAGRVALASIAKIPSPEIERKITSVVISNEALFSEHLPKIGPGLLKKWQGARHCLVTQSPDRSAHVCVSLRELLKGTVNALVENRGPAFRNQWGSKKPKFSEKAVALIQHTAIGTGFAQVDIAEIERLLHFLNTEGVHDAAADHTDNELTAVIYRVEGLLAYLIRLSGV